MKIASISNNFDKSYDGVGAFAGVEIKNLPSNIETDIFSADCNESYSSWKRLSDFGMTREILRVTKRISDYDVVLIDYPFVEWNPCILFAFKKLKKAANKSDTRIVLSLHEYLRCNFLRKTVIRTLCHISDLVFVANDEMKISVNKFCKKIVIRPIPSNIYDENAMNDEIKKSKSDYFFFGLVNGSKAFDEMMEAWDIFNKNEEKRLYILSSSELQKIEEKHKKVIYIHGASDDAVIKIMRSCYFCILPIKPEVDMKNTTFKTGSMTGAVCIGKFCNDYKSFPFVINMEAYSENDFLIAFEKSSRLTDDILLNMSNEAAKYGGKYRPDSISKSIAEELYKLIGGIKC